MLPIEEMALFSTVNRYSILSRCNIAPMNLTSDRCNIATNFACNNFVTDGVPYARGRKGFDHMRLDKRGTTVICEVIWSKN